MRQLASIFLFAITIGLAQAEPAPKPVFPTAIFPFDARGKDVSDMGLVVSDMIFKELTKDSQFLLVDSAAAKKATDATALERSNDVDVKEASQVGQELGAQLVVVGSVVQTEETIYLIAKIISTENTHVLGANVKGKPGDNLAVLAEALAEKISEKIDSERPMLLAPVHSLEDRSSALNATLGAVPRPDLILTVQEHHVGDANVDAVVEVDMQRIFTSCGFSVTNTMADSVDTGINVDVKAVSEVALQRSDVVSVRAWVECKVTDRASKKTVVDVRQFAVGVGAKEADAATQGLLKAADLIERHVVEALGDVK